MTHGLRHGTPRPGEYVYRRLDFACEFCGKRACIELHVGTGGNYRSVWVCADHDRLPDQDLQSGDLRRVSRV